MSPLAMPARMRSLSASSGSASSPNSALNSLNMRARVVASAALASRTFAFVAIAL